MQKRAKRSSPVAARRAGVLLHVTSAPGGHGVGDLGEGARRFADWAADAGFSVWQILPLHPVDPSGSPYSGLSAFAGNPLLVDLEDLVERGLLARRDLEASCPSGDAVDYRAVAAFKRPRLERAAQALVEGGGSLARPFAAFRRAAGPAWLDEAALHAAIARRNGGAPWWRWPEPLKRRHKDALRRAAEELAPDVARYAAIQFLFDAQWRALARHCEGRGVALLGDVPLYVSRRAVDVWAHPELFALGRDLEPEAVGGVPPDYFSARGQLWGNPVYRWRAHRAERFRWWTARLARELGLVDWVRLDHFRGFVACYEIPAGARDARRGAWVEAPGRALLEAAVGAVGSAPFVAEDLGIVDDGVIALRDAFRLPGMAVLQFAFGADPGSEHLPENHRARLVAYTGTHDNDTLLGWWRQADRPTRARVRACVGGRGGAGTVARLVRACLGSAARLAVIPMQDLLGLGSEARMNTPGSPAGGGWRWRLRGGELEAGRAARIRGWVEAAGRASPASRRRRR